MSDKSNYERIKPILLKMGYTYERDHIKVAHNRLSAPYYSFMKSLAANAVALTSSHSNFSHQLSRFHSTQETLSQTGLKLLINFQKKSSAVVEQHDSQALNETVDRYKDIVAAAQRALCNMFVISAVSLFEAYIQGVVYEIFMHYPETLRSGRVLTYDEILKHTDMRDLISSIAQVEAAKSTEGPVREYLERLERRFGINGLSKADIERVIALRNIIVHNGGIVDAAYLRHYQADDLQEGDQIELGLQDAADVSEIVRLTVDITEIRLVEQKFPTVSTVEWSEQAELCLDCVLALEEFASPTE